MCRLHVCVCVCVCVYFHLQIVCGVVCLLSQSACGFLCMCLTFSLTEAKFMCAKSHTVAKGCFGCVIGKFWPMVTCNLKELGTVDPL